LQVLKGRKELLGRRELLVLKGRKATQDHKGRRELLVLKVHKELLVIPDPKDHKGQ
jgi:hypothetical protein